MKRERVFLAGLCAVVLVGLGAVPAWSAEAKAEAPYINTWLVSGLFENDRSNAGFERAWIDEAQAAPREGQEAAPGMPWRYFDDRLFSRNYDDYQDLFSYFRVKLDQSVAAKVVYAHCYVHSAQTQDAHLRVGADNEFKAWVNGIAAGQSTESLPFRDMADLKVQLTAGWNRLLFKVGNQANGRFGFYARLSDGSGKALPGLTFSANGPAEKLAVTTKAMANPQTGPLPTAYREWAYVGANAVETLATSPGGMAMLRAPERAMRSSDFVLAAEGGSPPYVWSLVKGTLPAGLTLDGSGAFHGTPAKTARLDSHVFTVQVTDAKGAVAEKELALTVKERPNKWVEEARLTALIHSPENMRKKDLAEFAQLMKRQNYGLGMPISYNNGKHKYRWPSIYEPDCPVGDVVGAYKEALEKAGVAFGMYMGNFNGANHGGDNGAILLVEDAIRRYHPKAFWFDWAGWNGMSMDAIYSMIKSYDPETLVILNGIPTMSNGDWDIINLEGWNAWGDRIWHKWPFEFPWPKKNAVESWRYICDPAWDYSKGVNPDWQSYLRVQISLIGDGHIANIDHSPVSKTGLNAEGKLENLGASPLMQVHRKMADWANPTGLPPLHESYTQVNPGPLREATWGYDTMNLSREIIYLHMLKTPYGKTGVPETGSVTVDPLSQKVTQAICMNTGAVLPFTQDGKNVTVDVSSLKADPVDTIIKLRLAAPHPDVPAPPPPPEMATPQGNLAWRKPARLLNLAGEYDLVASAFNFAHYGVDGIPFTFSCGGGEWPWTYHVDLEGVHPVNRIVVRLEKGYPTQYEARLSKDGKEWTTVGQGGGSSFGVIDLAFDPVEARYVRILSIKPNGPNQEGSQMTVAELEVYEAK
jgi:F5/8 type C domain-containing protein/putative Ig domain-containing protein